MSKRGDMILAFGLRKKKPKAESDDEESTEGVDAAQELIDAIKDEDAGAVYDIFRDLVHACSSDEEDDERDDL